MFKTIYFNVCSWFCFVYRCFCYITKSCILRKKPYFNICFKSFFGNIWFLLSYFLIRLHNYIKLLTINIVKRKFIKKMCIFVASEIFCCVSDMTWYVFKKNTRGYGVYKNWKRVCGLWGSKKTKANRKFIVITK